MLSRFSILIVLAIASELTLPSLGQTELGEVCNIDSDCAPIPLSYCHEGTKKKYCSCNLVATVPQSDKKGCLPLVKKVGQPCSESLQCVHGIGGLAECKGRSCRCTDDAVKVQVDTTSDRCVAKTPQLGDRCQVDEQCTALLGDETTCFTGSEFKRKYCACKDYTTHVPKLNGKGCIPITREVDGPCEINLQCHLGIGGLSTCSRTGNCVCYENLAVPSASNKSCLKKANYGERCSEPGQCTLGANAACSNTTGLGPEPNRFLCTCARGYVLDGNVPGEQSCVDGSGKLNEPCAPNDHCGATNSTCLNDKCQCIPDEFIKANNTEKCLPIHYSVGSGTSCEERRQCTLGLGENSECSSSHTCVCSSGYGFYGRGCHKASRLNGACEADVNCFAGINPLAECVGRRCKCREGAAEGLNSCWEGRKLGGACTTNDICVANIKGDVECQSKKCACKSGSEAGEDGTFCSGAISILIGNELYLNLILMVTVVAKYCF